MRNDTKYSLERIHYCHWKFSRSHISRTSQLALLQASTQGAGASLALLGPVQSFLELCGSWNKLLCQVLNFQAWFLMDFVFLLVSPHFPVYHTTQLPSSVGEPQV